MAEPTGKFSTVLPPSTVTVAFAPAAVKKAAWLLGEDVGESRYPIVFSDADIAALKDIVARYGRLPA